MRRDVMTVKRRSWPGRLPPPEGGTLAEARVAAPALSGDRKLPPFFNRCIYYPRELRYSLPAQLQAARASPTYQPPDSASSDSPDSANSGSHMPFFSLF